MSFQITELAHILLVVYRAETAAPLSKAQWAQLGRETFNLPGGFFNLARQRVGASAHKFSDDFRELCLRWDWSNEYIPEMLAKLNDRAAYYSVSGNLDTKIQGVMLAEPKDAGVNVIGWSQAQVDKLSIKSYQRFSVGSGDPLTFHRNAVQAWYDYRTANQVAWAGAGV